MNFSEQLKSYQDLINQHLVVNPPAVPQRSDRLYEAMNYSLKAGKRLRPVLTMAAFDLFPGGLESTSRGSGGGSDSYLQFDS